MSTPESAPDAKFEIISQDGFKAVVNPMGAWVESFKTINGQDLLFERQENSTRGGVFACTPIFGSGYRIDQPQHGFGRQVKWRKVEQADPDRPKQDNRAGFSYGIDWREDSPYAGCWMHLSISIDSPIPGQAVLRMGLTVKNQGLQPLVVAPGFHPYFPIEAGKSAEDIEFNMTREDGSSFVKQFTATELEESKRLEAMLKGQPAKFSSNGYDIEILGDEMNRPVVWTDNPEAYVCFEPTVRGAVAAKNSETILELYQLGLGACREYNMQITWQKQRSHPERVAAAVAQAHPLGSQALRPTLMIA